MKLRARQIEFKDRCLTALHERGNTLGVAPTGAGKTVMLSAVAGEYVNQGANALVIQHRDELVEQNERTFRAVNPKATTGLFTADRKEWGYNAIFAMIQTLARAKSLGDMPPVDLIAVDEGHHAAADSYRKSIDALTKRNPNAKLLLVTATPNRGDKKTLRGVVDNVADQITLRELIDARLLVRPRTLVIDLGVNEELRKVKKTIADFDMKAVEEVMDKEVLNDRVVEEWRKVAGDRQTVVFCSTVQHAQHVTEAFQAAGVVAACIWADMGDTARSDALAAYDKGEIQVAVNVAVLTEGWDHQPTSCVILLRPSSYQSTMMQMIGRGLRIVDPERYPGVVKDDCVAEGSLVLTDHGLVPIEQVTVAMRLWDGVDFVSHQGPICRGEQEVITYAGLTATPDHKCWTDDGWKTLEACSAGALAIRVTGDDRAPVWETDRHFRQGDASGRPAPTTLDDNLSGMWLERSARSLHASDRSGGVSDLCSRASGTGLAHPSLQFRESPVRQSEKPVLGKLRWPGDRVSVPSPAGHGLLDRGQPGSEARVSDRPGRQRWPLRGGEPALGVVGGQSVQRALCCSGECDDALVQITTPGNHLRGCDASASDTRGVKLGGYCEAVLPVFKKTKRRVWDIINAGPRHRFTVNGLLVSNCIVMDFGTSVLTHGSIEQEPNITQQGCKECPECQATVPIQARLCPICNYAWPKIESDEPDDEGEPLGEGEGKQPRAELHTFVMSEVDLLADTPFRYEDLFEGLVSIASAIDAWVVVVSYYGRWHAVGGGRMIGVKHLANAEDRFIALSQGDDFLRIHGDSDTANKSKRWIHQPASPKQLEMLGIAPMAGFGVTKYRASCLLEWKFNERTIRRLLEGTQRMAA